MCCISFCAAQGELTKHTSLFFGVIKFFDSMLSEEFRITDSCMLLVFSMASCNMDRGGTFIEV